MRLADLCAGANPASIRASVISGAREVLSDDHQAVRTPHGNAPPRTVDQPISLPGGECAADRVQGGAGHFRQILARNGEVDLDANLCAATRLADQTDEAARDSLFDAGGAHLRHAALQFLNPRPQFGGGADGDVWMTHHEPAHDVDGPYKLDTIDHGGGVGWKRLPHEGGHRTEHLPRSYEADHELTAIGSGLGDLHPAMDQAVTGLGRRALPKGEGPLGEALGLTAGQDLLQRILTQSLEERDVFQG